MTMLASLMSKKEKLQEELRSIEKQPKEVQEISATRQTLLIVTSYLASELGLPQDGGRSVIGPGCPKAGAMPANGQGKPKRGRTLTTPRNGRRIRQSGEPDIDNEDDPDMSLRDNFI